MTRTAAGGRPLGFDRGDVLDRLVILFWTHGYHETTQAQMCAATGLSTSSLFNSFGTKAQLFDAVVERYMARMHVVRALLRGGNGLDGLRRWADHVDAAARSTSTPRGCLLVMSMNELAAGPIDFANRIEQWRTTIRDGLRDAIVRAQDQDVIRRGDPRARAALLHAAQIGAMTAARSGSPTDALLIVQGIRETIDDWSSEGRYVRQALSS